MSIPFPLTFVGSKVDEYGVNRNLTNGSQAVAESENGAR